MLRLPSLLFLISYCGTSIGGSLMCNLEDQTWLIFTIQDWSGSNLIGSSNIILLTPRA